MKKIYWLFSFVFAFFLIASLIKSVSASGRDGSIAIDQGTTSRFRVVSVSSTSGTALWDRQDTVDSICRVNGSYTVWIGSTSATQNNKTHDNITYGFFLLANETIAMGGAFSGRDYVTCNTATASCELRCRDSVRY